MKLVNDTWLEAEIFSGGFGEAELGCTALIKATYEIGEDGATLTPASENPWPVHMEELETPYGVFPADNPMPRPKVDFVVLGKARPAGGGAVTRMRVRLGLGDFSYAVDVVGDRVWVEQDDQIIPGPAQPFTEMDLTLTNAFGGKVVNEWGEMPYVHNPAGKGFWAEPDSPVGVAMPNLERPDSPLRNPTDRPEPVCPGVYPQDGGLRLTADGHRDADGRPVFPPAGHEQPMIYNCAHPDLMVEPLRGDELLAVDGVGQGSPLRLALPAFPGELVLRRGEVSEVMKPVMDTIIVMGEERRVMFRWRAAAVFPMDARTERSVTLTVADGGNESGGRS